MREVHEREQEHLWTIIIGFLGGVVGAVILLFVYGLIAGRQGRVT